ncbi:hypothetical protein OH76DRAFT_224349 [Lentinus brumalis]|uniref:Uncharacterized protein n=1 Tax=Lentinus brumalis TaxID=2498619 RepID=A0A371DH54_9APHY|nr:hypothetical protein OH76DRAFT_224349 [Polyporus brumalis]
MCSPSLPLLLFPVHVGLEVSPLHTLPRTIRRRSHRAHAAEIVRSPANWKRDSYLSVCLGTPCTHWPSQASRTPPSGSTREIVLVCPETLVSIQRAREKGDSRCARRARSGSSRTVHRNLTLTRESTEHSRRRNRAPQGTSGH